MKQKLIETVVSVGKIIEQDKSKLPSGVLSRASYVICNINSLNKNNRFYEKEVWDRVLENKEIQERIKKRNLWACDEHPEESQRTKTPDIAAIVTGIRIDENENKVYADFDILDTPKGRIIDALLRANCGIGVSTRADGELEEMSFEELKEYFQKKGYNVNLDEAVPENKRSQKFYRVVPEAYEFHTVDFTAEPSTIGGDVPLKVEKDIVSIVKEGLNENKIDKEFAKGLLSAMKCNEAKCLLESLESKERCSEKSETKEIWEKSLEDEIDAEGYSPPEALYLVNTMYGGYSNARKKTESGEYIKSGSYLPAEDVIEYAKKHNLPVHLAGYRWEEIGYKGWGEEVSPEEAEKAWLELKKKERERYGEIPIKGVPESVLDKSFALSEEDKKQLQGKTIAEAFDFLLKKLNVLSIQKAIERAEKDKVSELYEQKIAKVKKDLQDTIELHMEKQRILAETKDGLIRNIKSQLEEKNKRIKELQEQINSLKAKAQKVVKEIAEKVKAIYEKKIKAIEEKHKRELFEKTVIERKIQESGLQLPPDALALLKRCKTEAEVDALLERFRYDLKESLLHYKGDVNIGVPEEQKGLLGEIAETTKELIEGI